MRWVGWLLLVAACSKGMPSRKQQCDKVLAVFDGKPRRYYESVSDDQLAKLGPLDADLKDAVNRRDVKRFVTLCVTGSARDRDCALIRLYVPPSTDALIVTRSIPETTFEDPEIAAAMKEVNDGEWSEYTSYARDDRGSGDDRYAKLRTLCSIP